MKIEHSKYIMEVHFFHLGLWYRISYYFITQQACPSQRECVKHIFTFFKEQKNTAYHAVIL